MVNDFVYFPSEILLNYLIIYRIRRSLNWMLCNGASYRKRIYVRVCMWVAWRMYVLFLYQWTYCPLILNVNRTPCHPCVRHNEIYLSSLVHFSSEPLSIRLTSQLPHQITSNSLSPVSYWMYLITPTQWLVDRSIVTSTTVVYSKGL